MTAACGGGTSAPDPGRAAVVEYSAGLIAAIFAAYDLAWLIPVIPFVGLVPLTLATFCGNDPPAIPTFTAAEVDALVNQKLGADWLSGLAKLTDLVLNAIWYDACRCTSGALVPFAPPVQPAGSPTYQPPVPPNVLPCSTWSAVSSFCDTGSLFKGTAVPDVGTFPTGVLLHMVGTDCGAGTPAGTFNWVWTFKDASNATIATSTYSLTGSQTLDAFVAVPPGTVGVNLNHNQTSGSRGQQIIGSTAAFYCSSQVPGAQQPCCPPDVATQATLDAILKMVTLIQRQAVPFGYVTGTVHAGLSGAGAVSISGLLGVKVAITTLPTPLGSEGTSPPKHFDAGWITFGTIDGFPQSYRLEHNPQVYLPSRCSAFTDLDYDLAPGVVVTITELLREP